MSEWQKIANKFSFFLANTVKTWLVKFQIVATATCNDYKQQQTTTNKHKQSQTTIKRPQNTSKWLQMTSK